MALVSPQDRQDSSAARSGPIGGWSKTGGEAGDEIASRELARFLGFGGDPRRGAGGLHDRPRPAGLRPRPVLAVQHQYAPYVTADRPGRSGRRAGGVDDLSQWAISRRQSIPALPRWPGRARANVSDRSGIGMPYYRRPSTRLRAKEGGTRQYQPNVTRPIKSSRHPSGGWPTIFRSTTAERDPARRAELLREYRDARAQRRAGASPAGRVAVIAGFRTTRAGRSPPRVEAHERAPARGPRRRHDQPRARADRFGPAPECRRSEAGDRPVRARCRAAASRPMS